MAIGLDSIWSSIKDGVAAVNNLTTTIKSAFPQVSATSVTATTGALSFNSSQPSLFLTVITSSGGTYKTPLYLP